MKLSGDFDAFVVLLQRSAARLAKRNATGSCCGAQLREGAGKWGVMGVCDCYVAGDIAARRILVLSM